jgi:hypothetical protein
MSKKKYPWRVQLPGHLHYVFIDEIGENVESVGQIARGLRQTAQWEGFYDAQGTKGRGRSRKGFIDYRSAREWVEKGLARNSGRFMRILKSRRKERGGRVTG